VKLVGGIGNQLFGYFAGRAHSLLFKKSLELDICQVNESLVTREAIDEFNLAGKFIKKRNHFDFFQNFGTRTFSAGSLGFEEQILRKENLDTIKGYFQTYKYYDLCLNLDSSISPQLRNPSKFFKESLTEIKQEMPISIHVRRGDYRQLKSSFGLINYDFYFNCIENALAKYGERKIYIFGDEINVCNEFMDRLNSVGINAKVLFPPEMTPASESIMLMSFAKINIVGNSTFGWWGAKLNKDPLAIYAPTKWFAHLEDPMDLIPPDWIKVNSSWEA
jgi:hypothetical protein